MSAYTASYVVLRGGEVARTVEVPGGYHVDLDDTDRIIGVETFADNTDWLSALAVLAMQGRLAVPRRQQ